MDACVARDRGQSSRLRSKDRLLSIFDVFDGWFRKKSFEGCSLINVLLESKRAVRYVAQRSITSLRYTLSCVAWPKMQDCAILNSLHKHGIC